MLKHVSVLENFVWGLNMVFREIKLICNPILINFQQLKGWLELAI